MEGKMMIIRRARYGMKPSGAAYKAHFVITLFEMGYTPCKANPDVWLRTAGKSDGTEYYEYLLTYVHYVDNCLVVSHGPRQIINSW
jgi:hypothetical protein